jgi:hypothetical protein
MHMQDFMGHDGEAIMQDMINDEGEYTQVEANPEPGKHGYGIGAETLFLPPACPRRKG